MPYFDRQGPYGGLGPMTGQRMGYRMPYAGTRLYQNRGPDAIMEAEPMAQAGPEDALQVVLVGGAVIGTVVLAGLLLNAVLT